MSGKPKIDVAGRRLKVGDLYLKGWGQEAIARELDTSQTTVSRDLEELQLAWETESLLDFETSRRLELRKLDLIEREAWAAWDRSQQPLQSATLSEQESGRTKRTSLTHRCGDPRFLDQINKCIAQRCLLLGLQPQPTPQGVLTDDTLPLATRLDRAITFASQLDQYRRIGGPGDAPDAGQPGLAGPGDERGEVPDGHSPVANRELNRDS